MYTFLQAINFSAQRSFFLFYFKRNVITSEENYFFKGHEKLFMESILVSKFSLRTKIFLVYEMVFEICA